MRSLYGRARSGWVSVPVSMAELGRRFKIRVRLPLIVTGTLCVHTGTKTETGTDTDTYTLTVVVRWKGCNVARSTGHGIC